MAKPRAADKTLTGAVTATLSALNLQPKDQAARVLLLRYAAAIDDADDDLAALDKYGSKLFAMLERLGATPRATPGPPEGGGDGKPRRDWLAEERQAHRSR